MSQFEEKTACLQRIPKDKKMINPPILVSPKVEEVISQEKTLVEIKKEAIIKEEVIQKKIEELTPEGAK